MKYIVTGSANLRFADGSSFALTPGLHDDFPASVKEHWAFAHHAEELSDSAAAQQAISDDTHSARIAALESELTDLKAQLDTAAGENSALTAQLAARDAELTDLKAQLDTAADKGGKSDKK
ncbi:hypothetical protein [Kosakonia sacchari]|uniref:STY1053 family phage-associated protein n=1 Tax=Kosakonia sacchari TaxID=1158459 RepID=UPI0028AFA06C|nr:hypothetical protein [Kosakonia sacchari]